MATVFVTGGSRGIGLGIATKFLQAGYRVVINCKEDAENMQQVLASLQPLYGDHISGLVGDVSDYATAAAMADKIGFIDVLINNAGQESFGLFTDMQEGEIFASIRANLYTAINMCHIVSPAMIRAKKGAIINISSIWGVTGASCEVIYSTAKAGLIGLTKALGKELAPSGVRVNAIACGAISTRMNARLSPEEKMDFENQIPMGRFGTVEEVGDLAVYLASEKSSYLTGQAITLDGGLI